MKSKGAAYLLWCCCFLGLCGLHRFYLGKVGTGLLWLFTFGIFGVGQFIDLFSLGGEVDNENLKNMGGLNQQNVVVNIQSPDQPQNENKPASSLDSIGQLETLSKLLDQGHISKKEFDSQKIKLLSSK